MDLLNNLALGLSVAATWESLAFCLIGCLLGTLIGVLPGIGVIPTISLLLPLTFGLEPTSSLIMLAGIFYGAQYGGSTTAILVNMPGEASSLATTLEGHKLAMAGRAGAALAVAALASLFAGTVSTLLIALLAAPLGQVARFFNSTDYFALMLLGLIVAVALSNGSVIKAVAMVLIGLLLGMVGTDLNSGVQRYTFGSSSLIDGIDFLPLVLGMFGLVEVLRNLSEKRNGRPVVDTRVNKLWPNRSEFMAAWPAAVRGTGIGSLLGILPGGGAVLASFASYAIEKRIAGPRSMFGRGAIQGVAGPEAANNAGAQTSFIPLLTLGIPASPVMALMMGAMMIHGIQPGSAVMTGNPTLFWGLIASMWIGNLMLVLINLPMLGIWVKLVMVPYHWLFPVIVILCTLGVYSESYDAFSILLLAGFAAFGFLLFKLGCDPAPLVLGFVLGPLMEENLRRSLILSGGDVTAFVQRPSSALMLAICVLVVVALAMPGIMGKRADAFAEE